MKRIFVLSILITVLFASCSKDAISWNYSGEWTLLKDGAQSAEVFQNIKVTLDYYPDDGSMNTVIYQAQIPSGQQTITLKGIPLQNSSSEGRYLFHGENVVLHGTSEIAKDVNVSASKGRITMRITLGGYSLRYKADDGSEPFEGE